MTKTTRNFIESVKEECEVLKEARMPLFFDNDVEESYVKRCNEVYESYKRTYMDEAVTSLDRHKVAAILVIEAVAMELVKMNKEELSDGDIFIGKSKVPFVCALRYIQREYNSIIKGSNIREMTSFALPDAFSCDTKYIDIMCRIQFYSEKLYDQPTFVDIAVMDLADRFFLLEYIAIQKFYKEDTEKVYETLRKLTKSVGEG